MKKFLYFLFIIYCLLPPSGFSQIVSTYASGLPGAVGIQIDGRGWIWVAQIGNGNNNSKISVITGENKVYPFMTGLPSEVIPSGDVTGAEHVFFSPEGKLLIMQGGPSTDSLSQSILVVDTTGFIPGVSAPLNRSAIEYVYKVGEFLKSIGDSLSNPYTLTFGPNNDMYIADAAANAVVKRENSTGNLSIFAKFPNIPNNTGIGGPFSEVVPTGIVFKDNNFYIGSLTGFPFADSASTLYQVDLSGSVSNYKTGLTTIVDVTTDPDNYLVLLQHAAFQVPPPFVPNSGAVLRLENGNVDTLVSGLNRPTSIRFKSKDEFFVSTLTDGKIFRVVNSEIPGKRLQLWLRADTGLVFNGSKVSRWMDQSGNGNDAIESDTSRQPVLVNNVINNKPVISFDGVNDRLGFTGSKKMSQISLFMVFNNKSGASGSNPPGFVLTFGPGGTYAASEHFAIKMRGMDNGDNDIIVGTEDHNDYVLFTGQNIAKYNEWRNIFIVRDKTVSNTTLWWNGVSAPSSASGANISISVPLGDSTASGGGIGSTDNFPDLGRVLAKCDIAEIIVYDTVLSDPDQSTIEKYLSNKYNITVTGVEDSQNKNIPESYTLYQNYPNPFNPSTTIKFSIPQASFVTLNVYDILGKQITTLVNNEKPAGNYSINFNASNLPSGVYFYRMQAGSFASTKKFVLLK
ncbi:MAG: ScyD/ScyE family protein [Ignavibacteriaceae bacterium]